MIRIAGNRIQGHRAYKGPLVVPCRLNHTYRYRFLVDTGATMTVISQQTAHEMGVDTLHPLRYMRIASIHQTNQTPVIKLDSLQVGSQKFNNIEVLILSFPHDLRVDGLLGVNFLEKFRVAFEFDTSTLILR